MSSKGPSIGHSFWSHAPESARRALLLLGRLFFFLAAAFFFAITQSPPFLKNKCTLLKISRQRFFTKSSGKIRRDILKGHYDARRKTSVCDHRSRWLGKKSRSKMEQRQCSLSRKTSGS